MEHEISIHSYGEDADADEMYATSLKRTTNENECDDGEICTSHEVHFSILQWILKYLCF